MTTDYANNEFCNFFDQKKQNFLMKLEHCGRYLYALDTISNNDIVADIACATGYGSNLLSKKAKYVIGVDVNEEYLNEARKNYRSANLKFVQADLSEKLKLDKNISTIISFETIEHTKNPFAVVQNFYDILPPDGRLFLSFPNAKNEMFDENGQNLDPYHLSVIDYDEMINFLQKIGFKINCILGQSLINKLIGKIFEIEKDLNINIESLYNYEKNNILQQSRVLAYPNKTDIQNSYSYIFDLQK